MDDDDNDRLPPIVWVAGGICVLFVLRVLWSMYVTREGGQ